MFDKKVLATIMMMICMEQIVLLASTILVTPSTGDNPPEAGDEPIETSAAVQPTSNTEQKESIVENVDDPRGSPIENPSKKTRNA